MMKYRSKTKVAGVALAVASLTALAACSRGSHLHLYSMCYALTINLLFAGID